MKVYVPVDASQVPAGLTWEVDASAFRTFEQARVEISGDRVFMRITDARGVVRFTRVCDAVIEVVRDHSPA